MDRLENAINQLDSIGIRIDEKTLARHDLTMKGLYVHRAGSKPIVMIDSSLPHPEQLCILAEEAGHHFRSIGKVVEQNGWFNTTEERLGREWAYDHFASLSMIIDAWYEENHTAWDIAEYLDITEDFLRSALDYHHRKHGVIATVDNWIVQFDPYFTIYQDAWEELQC